MSSGEPAPTAGLEIRGQNPGWQRLQCLAIDQNGDAGTGII